MQKNFFTKSHGLGNEYIVLNSQDLTFELTDKAIQTICNIHYGIGSDGIVLKVPSQKADFGFRVFNPDASEAEKSGNGLRIFCKYLYDYAHTQQRQFTIDTKGGIVKATIDETVNGKASMITIEMGKASFVPSEIPVKCDKAEAMNLPVQVEDLTYHVNCVSVGNPHCIILKEHLDKKEIIHYGPLLENHKTFPNRINVQFVKVISRHEAEILIWERGAGFTQASGSSSCAVAAVLRKLGLCEKNISIKMPGGALSIGIDDQWNITLKGSVNQIAEGYLVHEFIEQFKEIQD
jgi:diaminopimelate epimerase